MLEGRSKEDKEDADPNAFIEGSKVLKKIQASRSYLWMTFWTFFHSRTIL